MMCRQLRREALTPLPPGFHFRYCRPDELETWENVQLDGSGGTRDYLREYYQRVYAPKSDLFFRTCQFVCDADDRPVGSGFIWKQYDQYTTVHWIKVIPAYEGLGLGRALLSHLFAAVPAEDHPIYLHTQSSSVRALKLYSDFGFAILTGPEEIDGRPNQWLSALEVLEREMPPEAYAGLRFTPPPPA